MATLAGVLVLLGPNCGMLSTGKLVPGWFGENRLSRVCWRARVTAISSSCTSYMQSALEVTRPRLPSSPASLLRPVVLPHLHSCRLELPTMEASSGLWPCASTRQPLSWRSATAAWHTAYRTTGRGNLSRYSRSSCYSRSQSRSPRGAWWCS